MLKVKLNCKLTKIFLNGKDKTFYNIATTACAMKIMVGYPLHFPHM